MEHLLSQHVGFALVLGLILFMPLKSPAQNIGINTNTPDASAALEIFSPSRGFLMPRSDTSLVNGNGTPATGLIIYQNSDNLFYYFNGTKWEFLATGNGAFVRNGSIVRQSGH